MEERCDLALNRKKRAERQNPPPEILIRSLQQGPRCVKNRQSHEHHRGNTTLSHLFVLLVSFLSDHFSLSELGLQDRHAIVFHVGAIFQCLTYPKLSLRPPAACKKLTIFKTKHSNFFFLHGLAWVQGGTKTEIWTTPRTVQIHQQPGKPRPTWWWRCSNAPQTSPSLPQAAGSSCSTQRLQLRPVLFNKNMN